MVDYNALGKKATQNQEKDSHTFDEGETLIHLIPVEGLPDDMPYAHAMMYGRPLSNSDYFKRSAIDSGCELAQTEAYKNALGREVPNPCEIGEWVKENLSGDEARSAKAKGVYFWAICALASRKKAKNDWGDCYTKPKWMTAKQGSSNNPHLQACIEKLMADGKVDPAKLFDPDGAQLLVVNRTGSGNGTKYTVEAASDEYDGQDTSNFALSDEVKSDIADATKPGGSCDLIQVIADRFSPDHEEIREKLYGEKREGSGGGDKPGMDE